MDDSEVPYKGFVIHPKPRQHRDDESWSTTVHIQRGGSFKLVTAKNSWPSEEEAIKGCVELGRRVIDGEVVGMSVDDL
jgi:hypothetical protein